jgi:hypothetical protein
MAKSVAKRKRQNRKHERRQVSRVASSVSGGNRHSPHDKGVNSDDFNQSRYVFM